MNILGLAQGKKDCPETICQTIMDEGILRPYPKHRVADYSDLWLEFQELVMSRVRKAIQHRHNLMSLAYSGQWYC